MNVRSERPCGEYDDKKDEHVHLGQREVKRLVPTV